MKISIKPFDTLFFRDGKPFHAREDSWSDVMFPPNPSVLYGAIRTTYFSEHPDLFADLKAHHRLNTSSDPTTKLIINRIFYKYIGKNFTTYVIPLPNDYLEPKSLKKNENIGERLTNIVSSGLGKTKTEYVFNNIGKEYKTISDGYIEVDDLYYYLENDSEFNRVKLKHLNILHEPKIGIKIDSRSNTTEESYLYRTDMLRLDDSTDRIELVVDFQGIEIKERGFLKLGGENKIASYNIDQSHDDLKSVKLEGNRFLMYLSTPTIFKNGWLPGFIDENSLLGEIEGLQVHLLTAIIGKPRYIGGFDMNKNRPKPMKKAVPAGSIYIFEIMNKKDIKKLKNIQGISISDCYPKEGFGIAYFGNFRG